MPQRAREAVIRQAVVVGRDREVDLRLRMSWAWELLWIIVPAAIKRRALKKA